MDRFKKATNTKFEPPYIYKKQGSCKFVMSHSICLITLSRISGLLRLILNACFDMAGNGAFQSEQRK